MCIWFSYFPHFQQVNFTSCLSQPRWLNWMCVLTRSLQVRPPLDGQHSFEEIDHEIFSSVILSLLLFQEGQLSDSGERMPTVLVNRLGLSCPVKVWLGKLTALDMTPLGWLSHKTLKQTNCLSKNYLMSTKHCRPWSEAALYGIWFRSTLLLRPLSSNT